MGWRLPFVSRSLHELHVDLLRKELEKEQARAKEQLEKEQARSKELLEMVLDLKLAGAAIDRRVKPGTKVPKRPRSDVDQAIDENALASNNTRLRAHLHAWAEKELAKDPESDEHAQKVIDRLRTWHVVSGEDDDDDDRYDGDDFEALEREIERDDSAIPVGRGR